MKTNTYKIGLLIGGALFFLLLIWSFYSPLEDTLTRRLRSRKSNTDIQGDKCLSCLNTKDTISIELVNDFIDGFPCEVRQIEVIKLMIKDHYGQICTPSIDPPQISIPYSFDIFSTRFHNPPLHPPFSLRLGWTALLQVSIDCPELVFDGTVGAVFIQYRYLDCEGNEIVTPDLLIYDIGCPTSVENNILYTQHSTRIQEEEMLLPYYSFAESSIVAKGNVKVFDGTAVRFKVCPKGKIKVEKDSSLLMNGIKVEKGAFFKAERVKEGD